MLGFLVTLLTLVVISTIMLTSMLTRLPTNAIIAKPAYNNIAIVADSAPGSGDFDTLGTSYSNDALSSVGFVAGNSIQVSGATFQWPRVQVGQNDNWRANGQIIPVTATGVLAFLGAASSGPSSGIATIAYTDGTKQQVTLRFSDWTLNGGTANLLPAESIAATLPYRDNGAGKDHITNYLFVASITLAPGKHTRSVTLPTKVNTGQLHVFAVAQGVTQPPIPTPIPSPNWSMYGYDLAHDFYNPQESTINTGNASQLRLIASFPNNATQGNNNTTGISGQVVVVNGVLYYGSWDGYFRASSPTGHVLWSIFMGQMNVQGCDPAIAGIAGTPTYAVVNGTPTIFTAGGDGWMYALNATSGAVLWSVLLGDTKAGYYIWDSPELYDGNIYIGVSSYGDCPSTQGKLFKLDAGTGKVQGTFNIVPDGCTGGGLWGSPTIDTASGIIYIATGNISSCPAEPYAQAVDAIDSVTMTAIASWQIPQNLAALTSDTDFGSTPTLFTATINGQNTPMIGVISKDGQFTALQRVSGNFSGTWTPVWTANIADAGDCPECGGGSIAPAAFDGVALYVAGGKITINGTQCQGSLDALDPATGNFRWRQCYTDGPVLGAVTVANGVIFVGHGQTIALHDARSGGLLFHSVDTAAHSAFSGGVTIANGHIYVGNMDGTLTIFGK